jgi:hypothetical protein
MALLRRKRERETEENVNDVYMYAAALYCAACGAAIRERLMTESPE